MFTIAEGIQTDSVQGRELALESDESGTWNPVEGKWEL